MPERADALKPGDTEPENTEGRGGSARPVVHARIGRSYGVGQATCGSMSAAASAP